MYSYEANSTTVSNILFSSTSPIYKIPRYQRPYTWSEDEVNEFWTDIKNENSTFFIGSFIFNNEYLKRKKYVEIIDGQQRLLTITIFCCALRNYATKYNLKSHKKSLSKLIQRSTIAKENSITGLDEYRVIPGDLLEDFFLINFQEYDSDIILKIEEDETNNNNPIYTKEEKLVIENYKLLYKKIENHLVDYHDLTIRTKEFLKIIAKLNQLNIIKIVIENEDVAYEIFETVNARGVELSVSDLLKNLILKNLKKKLSKDKAKEKWDEIEKNVEAANTEVKKFIRYYWISKYEFLQEKKLYKEIKNKITDWEGFLDDLHKSSITYNLIITGDAGEFNLGRKTGKIFKSIFAIRLMNVSQCHVFFLSVLDNYDKFNLDISSVFKMIENFTYQYSAICKLPGNKVERLYSKYSIDLNKILKYKDEDGNKNREKKLIIKNVKRNFDNFKKELIETLPIEELFLEKFKELKYKNSQKQRMIIKYTLNKIESYRQNDEKVIDFSKVNIEHILPQEPSKWGYKKQDIIDYVHDFGNLTLIHETLNYTMGNESLKTKIKELKKSKLSLNKNLLDFIEKNKGEWNEDSIYNRRDELGLHAIRKVWKI